MPLRSLLLVLALVLVGAFLIANWGAVMAPVPVSLIFTEVNAPLGLILVIVTLVLVVLFSVVLLYQQAHVILEARRWHKEVDAQRALADKAEASRFTELREFLAAEIGKIDARDTGHHQALLARLEALEAAAGKRQEEAVNTLAACVGEVDDKVDRLLGRPAP